VLYFVQSLHVGETVWWATDQTTTWHDWSPCPERQLQLWSYCYKSGCASLYLLLYFAYHIFQEC